MKKKKYEVINFSDYKGIIFTSSNAIKFLDIKLIDKKINCFCVGNQTEKKARSIGFQNVIAADGNVSNLKELILQNFDPKYGKLVYISGEFISDDLDHQLSKAGYTIQRIVNYKTVHNKSFDENFIKELKVRIPDIVFIYSQNSALSFLKLIKNHNFADFWMNTNLMCISEKTSSVLNEIKWKKIFIFNPGEEEFLLYKI